MNSEKHIDELKQRIRELEAENTLLRKAGPVFINKGDTVKVPDKLKSVFKTAENTVREYFKNFKATPSKGTIEIADQRYVLIRASALSYEFLNSIRSLYADRGEKEALLIGRSFLFDIAHVIGIEDAHNFHEKMKIGRAHV